VPLFFFTVEQQERAIVERFGKFVRVAGPGLQTKTPFVERVAGRMSLQVEQLNSQIETKTKDNVFVVIKLAVQYKVGASDQQVQDAYYKLDDPEVQMQSYAFDVVRSHIPSMDLDEAYADADTIAMHIQDTLHSQMATYGYEIVKALITNIEPDQRVKDAMNNINASQRNQVAAAAQGDAQKTLAVKKAEGERETMRLQGEGVAAERKAIAEGLHESLEIISQHGLDPKEAMALVALTQYTDMIRALGEASQTNTILLPHSPSGVGDLMSQIRDGILIADAATEGQATGPRRAIQGGSSPDPRPRPGR
jgi:regulator of protease activity HflC (stomatin/prohibitin superfamily)